MEMLDLIALLFIHVLHFHLLISYYWHLMEYELDNKMLAYKEIQAFGDMETKVECKIPYIYFISFFLYRFSLHTISSPPQSYF